MFKNVYIEMKKKPKTYNPAFGIKTSLASMQSPLCLLEFREVK